MSITGATLITADNSIRSRHAAPFRMQKSSTTPLSVGHRQALRSDLIYSADPTASRIRATIWLASSSVMRNEVVLGIAALGGVEQ